MSSETNPHPTVATLDSNYTASIFDWIHKVPTLPNSSSSICTPLSLETTPSYGSKRCRRSSSTPSEFLESGPYCRKRRKGHMGDKDPAQLPTPSMDRSISSDSKVSGDTKTSSTSKYTLSTTPHTPKKQKTCASQDNISYRMALRGLKQGGTAFDAAEEFKQYIRRIVLSERSSAMKDSTAKKFTETLKFYEGSNKATFLYHMIPILQGEGYHVSPEKKQRMDKETQEWKTFLTDEKVKFAKDPTLEEDMIKALAKDEDMKNPRPDLTFGLQRDKFPLDMPIPDHILDLLEIVPGMHHAFLLLEGKSPAGSLANAENQACRGGATLVKALRTLRALLENDTSHASEEIIQGATAPEGATPTKPDYKSFVFSATMNPAVFNIYVNWFDEGSKYYHKDLVESYALKNSKGPGEIREGLHNIIEWAVRTRRKQIEDLIRLIKDYTLFYWQRLQDEPTAKATAKTGKSAGEFGVQESDAN